MGGRAADKVQGAHLLPVCGFRRPWPRNIQVFALRKNTSVLASGNEQVD
jgi:hypothetical protein